MGKTTPSYLGCRSLESCWRQQYEAVDVVPPPFPAAHDCIDEQCCPTQAVTNSSQPVGVRGALMRWAAVKPSILPAATPAATNPPHPLNPKTIQLASKILVCKTDLPSYTHSATPASHTCSLCHGRNCFLVKRLPMSRFQCMKPHAWQSSINVSHTLQGCLLLAAFQCPRKPPCQGSGFLHWVGCLLPCYGLLIRFDGGCQALHYPQRDLRHLKAALDCCHYVQHSKTTSCMLKNCMWTWVLL